MASKASKINKIYTQKPNGETWASFEIKGFGQSCAAGQTLALQVCLNGNNLLTQILKNEMTPGLCRSSGSL